MAKPLSSSLFARRAIVSAVALCLFALQMLSLALGTAMRPGAGDAPGLRASGSSAYCKSHRDGGAPSRDGDHAQCCLLCAAGRDAPSALPAPPPAPASDPHRRFFVFLPHRPAAPPAESPAGWASSWSSRAPPRA